MGAKGVMSMGSTFLACIVLRVVIRGCIAVLATGSYVFACDGGCVDTAASSGVLEWWVTRGRRGDGFLRLATMGFNKQYDQVGKVLGVG